MESDDSIPGLYRNANALNEVKLVSVFSYAPRHEYDWGVEVRCQLQTPAALTPGITLPVLVSVWAW